MWSRHAEHAARLVHVQFGYGSSGIGQGQGRANHPRATSSDNGGLRSQCVGRAAEDTAYLVIGSSAVVDFASVVPIRPITISSASLAACSQHMPPFPH